MKHPWSPVKTFKQFNVALFVSCSTAQWHLFCIFTHACATVFRHHFQSLVRLFGRSTGAIPDPGEPQAPSPSTGLPREPSSLSSPDHLCLLQPTLKSLGALPCFTHLPALAPRIRCRQCLPLLSLQSGTANWQAFGLCCTAPQEGFIHSFMSVIQSLKLNSSKNGIDQFCLIFLPLWHVFYYILRLDSPVPPKPSTISARIPYIVT